MAISLPRAASADSPGAGGNSGGPLQIQVYSSLLGGVRESEARAVAKTLVRLVARQVDYPFEVGVAKGTTREDLLEVGAKLANGTYHFVALYGMEYGWLRSKYPQLKVLAVCSAGEAAFGTLRYQMLVRRKDKVTGLESLQGKRLASHRGETILDRLIRDDLVRKAKQNPRGFFRDSKPVTTIRKAVEAVLDDEADCVFVDGLYYGRLLAVYPSLREELVALRESEPYAEGTIIGSPERINSLRDGLWDEFQRRLLRVHTTPEGAIAIKFWGFDSFVPADQAYHDRVERWVRELPITSLPSR
jgi:ABC-type phosphate/phosphonate transport system substrate-binding protein